MVCFTRYRFFPLIVFPSAGFTPSPKDSHERGKGKGKKNPPTPAFAKAGAAPGTTGGVELGSRVASKGTRHQGNTSASYTCPSHLHAPAELLHLHAPAICFSGGSRLPFARPQTPQTLPQASKATTLTATCPCHLFFREFKTAV